MSAAEREHRVAVEGASLRVLDSGPAEAPAVVLLHSIMTSAALWDAQLQLLQSLGLRVVRPELRGHGGSSASPPPYTLDLLAQDVVAVLDALAIERAHVVGLSIGGSTAIRLSATVPERLLSLVICDARADGPAALAGVWDERIALAQGQGMQAMVEPTLKRWFGATFLSEAPERDAVAAMIAATTVDGFVGSARAIQSFDDRAAVAAIAGPVSLIVGANDGVLPELMRAFCGSLPHSMLTLIPEAGHLPNVENGSAFNEALRVHFQTLANRPPAGH